MARGGGRNNARVRQLRRQVSRACAPTKQRTARRSNSKTNTQANARRANTTTRELANSSRLMAVAPSGAGRRENSGTLISSLFGGRVARDEVRRARQGERYNGKIERVNLDTDRQRRNAKSTSSGRSSSTYVLATGRGKRKSLRSGSSRTVCVRLCDGFYFPINNRSHSDNFYDEHAMCVGRCPGADVSLYVHNNESPVEGMRSTMTGEPYVNLPTAFSYRRKSVADCSCRAHSTVVGDLSAEKALREAGLAPGAAEPKDGGQTRIAAWTRYRAVYDETGKELKLFPKLGRKRGEQKSEDEAAEKPSLTPLPRSGPQGPPLPLLVASTETDEGVRPIGPQAYADTIEASQKADARRDVRPHATVRSTAITVVPLEPVSVTAPQDRRAEGPTTPGPSAFLVPKDDGSPTLFAASNKR